jgi:hypothetical protein
MHMSSASDASPVTGLKAFQPKARSNRSPSGGEICVRIAASVALLTRQPLAGLMGGGRAARLTRARHVAMYLANTLFGVSMAEIGRAFGRDRSTVIYACHVVEDERDDPAFDQKLELMERLIREEEEALNGR